MHDLRVFWPQNTASNGTIIGWLHENVAVVAAVIEGEDAVDVEGHLRGHEKWLELKEDCQRTPTTLGIVNGSNEGVMSIRFQDESLNHVRTHFVLYVRPSLYHMQFFSVSPLQLDITTQAYITLSNSGFNDPTRNKVLLESGLSSEHSCDLRSVAHQLNASDIIDTALKAGRPPASSSAQPKSDSGLSLGMSQTFRALLQTLFGICNLQISLFDSTTRLKDVSATAQQFDVRLEQFSFFPSQVRLIQTRSRRNIATYSAQYINFYNNVWLIFNDVVIGTAVGTILCENHQYFGQLLYTYTEEFTLLTPILRANLWTVRYIIEALTWLDDWPAGLKLNTELSRALYLSFMTLTNIWGYALGATAGRLPGIIYMIGVSGYVGLTMILSLSSDLLSLLTVHIYISYLAATTACHRILLTAGSLWNLFRGKRYNVLQKRLDSWDYSLDQLLLGTMLFTLVAFLSPTILVYYGLFAAARLIIILIHATSETLLAFMNHFPLFVLMLRIKDPRRLPGGIVFVPTQGSEDTNGVTLTLKNAPIPFSGIFFQHLLLWGRLSSHYHPVRLIGHVATASFINPIPRYSIRYSMLPVASTSPGSRKEKQE